MARCKNCNQVFSDSYLIDGICEDCIEDRKSEIEEKNKEIQQTISYTKILEKNYINNNANIPVSTEISTKNAIKITFIILCLCVIFFALFSGNNTDSHQERMKKIETERDNNPYQDRLERERANTQNDIRKAIEEANYQEYKRNH